MADTFVLYEECSFIGREDSLMTDISPIDCGESDLISEIFNNLNNLMNRSAITVRIDMDLSIKKGEFSISTRDLIEKYPPRFSNRYKYNLWLKILRSYNENRLSFTGNPIFVSQYCGDIVNINLQQRVKTEIESVDYYFDYAPSTDNIIRWYLNFADPILFVAYGSNLFAQDEIQCLEHPLLGSVKEYIESGLCDGVTPRTITQGDPTPVLIENVPYMVNVQTTINKDGASYSIYGNSFHNTELQDKTILDECIHIKEDISESNIIAMCAPYPESGKYREETIEYLLNCAIVAFAATKERAKDKSIEIHTGRWGAGAFGGNEELAILVQIMASNIVGVQRLVFHAVNIDKLRNAVHLNNEFFQRYKTPIKPPTIIEYLLSIGYEWGLSDGN